MKDRTTKAMSRQAFQELALVGGANGMSNRARSMPSKRDKERDAKRQRRDWTSRGMNYAE